MGEQHFTRSGGGDRSPCGKTSRRSGGMDATALHLVSAFAAGAGLVLGQRATAEKSNEITAIPGLLSTLALTGCTVTIDAMGTQTAIAGAIQERGADYVLAVKDTPDAERIRHAIRSHWAVENRLHWVMDVSFNDDQMRARTRAAAHNLAVLKHTSHSIGSDSIPSNDRAASKHEESSPLPPTNTALNSSDSLKVHAIALAADAGLEQGESGSC